MPSKPGKVQLNLWIAEGTSKDLESLASQMHLRGRTQVAEWIIERYLATVTKPQRQAGMIQVVRSPAKADGGKDQEKKRRVKQ